MRTPLSRATFVAGSAAMLGAAALPLRTVAQSAKMRIGIVATDVSAEPYYAEAGGFFKKAGIDVEIQALPNGGAIISAIAGGALDAGFANLTSAATAHQRGIPIALLAPATVYTIKSPITVLMKAKGAKFKSGADLNGKTIAVSTLHGELQVGASEWVEKTGGDAKSVQFIEMPFSSMAAALSANRIHAAMMSEPQITQDKDKIELLSDAYSAIGPEFLIGVFVGSAAWAKANADTAKRFADAMAETAKWANTNRAKTAPILAAHSKISPAVIASMTRATYGERLTPELIQPVLDAAAKYGTLKPVKAADLLA